MPSATNEGVLAGRVSGYFYPKAGLRRKRKSAKLARLTPLHPAYLNGWTKGSLKRMNITGFDRVKSLLTSSRTEENASPVTCCWHIRLVE